MRCSIDDRSSRAAQRRAHILEISRRLFIENGFHGTGVAQIASASGVKVGQLYRDFASKEDIVAAIAARDLSRFLDEAALDHAIRVGDIAGIRAWILTFVSYTDDFEGYRLMPEIMAESARNPRIAAVLATLSDQIQNTLLTALAACAPGDRYATARADLADLINTLGGGLCQWIVVTAQQGRDFRRLCAQLSSIIERELDALIARTKERSPFHVISSTETPPSPA